MKIGGEKDRARKKEETETKKKIFFELKSKLE